MAPNAQLRNHIEVGCLFLSHFQPGIGPIPFDFRLSKDIMSPEGMERLEKCLDLQKVVLAEAEKDIAAMRELIRSN
jgi:hypothetical protein